MLRITTVTESPTCVTLKLEGRIVSDWVPLLEHECLTALRANRQVRLDFSEVTFIDRSGMAMLQRLAAARVEIINASAFTEALLARAGVRSRRVEDGR